MESKTYILRGLTIFCDVKHNCEYNESKFKFKILSYVKEKRNAETMTTKTY